MNVFGILSSDDEETLTEENYCEKTNKDKPYYRPDISPISPYFAICPRCKNPIQIINLYKNIMEENITGRKGLHGKHYTQSIPELAVFDSESFNACSLKAKVPLGYHKIRTNDIENERLKNLVDNNRSQIRNYIREMVNIYFKNNIIDEWIDAYLNRRYYKYKCVDDRNLPYSILVTHQAINIYGQKISNTDIGLEIRDAIIRKSKYFKLETEENGRIVQKEKNLRYPKIRLVLFGHKIIDEEEIIKLKMYEEIDGKEKVLMNIELDVMDCPL